MDPQRIPPEYWTPRLRMAKAMGLNTISSSTHSGITWSRSEANGTLKAATIIHSSYTWLSKKGSVLRPGPYICGEREWGGFLAWLSEIPDMAVRQSNKPFHDIIIVLLCLRFMPRRLEGLPSTRESKARRLQCVIRAERGQPAAAQSEASPQR